MKQQYLETMGIELGPIYYAFWNECATLYWKWNEYVALYGSFQARVDLLNSAAPAFFMLVQDTLWENILLHIARMMDSPKSAGKPNLSLRRLPDLVAPEIRPEVKNLLEFAQQSCEFACDWRRRHIAHRDLGLALEENVESLAPANKKNVDEALRSIAAVLNHLEFHYCDGTVAYKLFEPLGGVEVLARVLGDGRKLREARLRAIRSGNFPLPGDLL